MPPPGVERSGGGLAYLAGYAGRFVFSSDRGQGTQAEENAKNFNPAIAKRPTFSVCFLEVAGGYFSERVKNGSCVQFRERC